MIILSAFALVAASALLVSGLNVRRAALAPVVLRKTDRR